MSATETVEMPPVAPRAQAHDSVAEQPVTFRATMHQLHRRPFGVAPATLLGACGAVAFVAAVVLFATGEWIGGVIVLGMTLGVFALFAVAIDHQPDTVAARLTRRALIGAGALIRLLAVRLHAWSRAVIALVRLTLRRHRLRWKLKGQLAPLGEAVYRGDTVRAGQLKAQAAEIEEALEQADRDASAVVASAREHVERERATAQPTEALPVDQLPSDAAPGGAASDGAASLAAPQPDADRVRPHTNRTSR